MVMRGVVLYMSLFIFWSNITCRIYNLYFIKEEMKVFRLKISLDSYRRLELRLRLEFKILDDLGYG